MYNLVQAKKTRIQKIILENRIKYLSEIRDGFSSFIGLCNIDAINYAKTDSNVMKVYAEKLFNGFGKIKTYIKPFYKIDKDLLDLLDSLYYCVLNILNDKNEECERVETLRESFADKYLKYDWAYWKYIQTQKNGKYVNSDDAFDKVYNEFMEEIKLGSF